MRIPSKLSAAASFAALVGLSIAAAVPGDLFAQTPTPPFATRGAFIGLSVADLEASTKWYSEKLGLRVVMQAPKHEKSQATVLEGGGLIVELMRHDDSAPLSTIAPSVRANFLVQGVFKAGLIVDDYEKTIETLKARGVQIAIGPFPESPQQPANFMIRDNAGNFIQFFRSGWKPPQ